MNLPACKLEYTCPECGDEFVINVAAYREGKLYGPPEDCYPAEWDGFDPDKCPRCGVEIDGVWIVDSQRDAHEAELCNQADFKRKERMEGYEP